MAREIRQYLAVTAQPECTSDQTPIRIHPAIRPPPCHLQSPGPGPGPPSATRSLPRPPRFTEHLNEDDVLPVPPPRPAAHDWPLPPFPLAASLSVAATCAAPRTRTAAPLAPPPPDAGRLVVARAPSGGRERPVDVSANVPLTRPHNKRDARCRFSFVPGSDHVDFSIALPSTFEDFWETGMAPPAEEDEEDEAAAAGQQGTIREQPTNFTTSLRRRHAVRPRQRPAARTPRLEAAS